MSPCSCPPRGPQLFHSHVNCTSKIVLAKCDFLLSLRSHFTSQERACKCTFDFHSEVTSLQSSSHSGRLATVARASFCGQSSCSCELDTEIGALHPAARTPTVGWVLLLVQYLLRYCDTSYWTGSHSTLSYLICGASSCSTELVLATRCNLNKINCVLFPLNVLWSLSFLIPSSTKITCHLILWYISL